MNELFEKAPIKKVYFQLALPVVIGMITTMIYNLADTMFVAKTGDTNLVAGVTIGAPLFNFLMAISDIFGLGGSSVISRLFGEKRYKLSKRVSSFCLYFSIFTSLVLTDLLLFYFTMTKAKYINVDPRLMKIDGKTIKEIVTIGIPSSVTNFAQTFGMALLNSSLAVYGANEVAAMGITQKIYNIVILVIVGFAFGAQPLVGYNYGAKNWQRLRKIINFDILVQVIYAVIVGGILILCSRFVVGLFMSQATIVNYGVYMLVACLISTPLVGIVLVYTTVFQSIGNAIDAFIMAITRQGVIYFLVMIVAKQVWGFHGVVWSQAISDTLTWIIGFYLYHRIKFNQK